MDQLPPVMLVILQQLTIHETTHAVPKIPTLRPAIIFFCMTAYMRKASRTKIRLLEIKRIKITIDYLLTTAIRTSITATLPMGWSILHLNT